VRDGEDPARSRMALDELCNIYWRPIYGYARHQGLAPPDAEDITQSFFAFILEKDLFSTADASLGKLRNYLLTAFGRHIKHWQRQSQAQKRGGGKEVLSLEGSQDEDELGLHAPDHRTPEALYQRLCALRMIETAVDQLAEEQKAAGKAAQFQFLRPRLDPSQPASGSDHELAEQLGMSHDAVRQTISRLRKRFREIMREIVASTLRNPTEEAIQEELLALREALIG
jgi:RNA polymerase sigma-70 factor (ECF subfamily)